MLLHLMENQRTHGGEVLLSGLEKLRWVVFDQKSFGCLSLGTQAHPLPLSILALQGRLAPGCLKWLCHLPGWDELLKMVMLCPVQSQGRGCCSHQGGAGRVPGVRKVSLSF